MSLRVIQQNLQVLLQSRLLNCNVSIEWRTKMGEGIYSPILDIAVGPFAIENGIQLINEYGELYAQNINFIRELVKVHFINISPQISNQDLHSQVEEKLYELSWFNKNPRCFIAIEIENQVSRKHLMGGAINASTLGKIGLAVGFDEEKHRAFLRLWRYFQFLQQVEKPTFQTKNILIISYDQLLSLLQ